MNEAKVFKSIKPKLVNQLLNLPDMNALSPLHVMKMSPSNSKKTNLNINIESQKMMASIANQNSPKSLTNSKKAISTMKEPVKKGKKSSIKIDHIIQDHTRNNVTSKKLL